MGGSPIEQRGYKKVHWEKRDLVGKTKRTGSTMKCVVSCCECFEFGTECETYWFHDDVCCFLLRVFRVWNRMGHLLCFPALATTT